MNEPFLRTEPNKSFVTIVLQICCFTEHFKKRLNKLVYKEHDFYKWRNRVCTVVMIVRSCCHSILFRLLRCLKDSERQLGVL